MHGGKSSGAPTGKANGNYKHGKQTQERIEQRREFKRMIREAESNTRQTSLYFRELKKMARELGVRWPKLWKLYCKNDGGAELTLFIAKRIRRANPDL